MATRRKLSITFDLCQICKAKGISTNNFFSLQEKKVQAVRTNLFLPTHVTGPSYPPTLRIAAAATAIVRRCMSGIEHHRWDYIRITEKA
jgi:hypothetical protein